MSVFSSLAVHLDDSDMMSKAAAPVSSPEIFIRARAASFAMTTVSSCKSNMSCRTISGTPSNNSSPSLPPVIPNKNSIDMNSTLS